ncbi:RNA helicase [Malassezia vespertilionis]|uniref:RNA helicase n=1 Tax=Malassezia vespertilionis TaxID=2020962 RepID=A0A2N1JD02_9BASI|nr:RNA helicase [Malassezia vespertilionis]PKI84414.1 Ecm16p [Malassezia vespertilionis]WFD06456.1 RNA helicase [Malassezia vespertilionis]
MQPKKRERFNAKARQSSVGGSSHKGKKSMRERIAIQEANTNAVMVDEETKAALAAQDQKRRALLRAGGNDEHGKIDSKKRKRLDKFIDAKLRKEEKVRLLAKLAQTSEEISDRTELISAATLGTGRATKEAQRVMNLMNKGERKRGAVYDVQEDEEDEDLDEGENKFVRDAEDDHVARQERISNAARTFESDGAHALVPTAAFGSALATQSDGKPVMPTMRKRKRKSSMKSNMALADRVALSAHRPLQQDMEFSEEEDDVHTYDVDKAMEEARAQVRHERTWKVPVEPLGSTSDVSVATAELESEDSETNEEEDAVLLHAMRLRGMRLPKDGGNDIASMEGSDREDEEGNGVDDDDGEDESDSDSDSDSSDENPTTAPSSKSQGFKQWALEALDLARPSDERTTEGQPLEPVGGHVQRVGDLIPKDGKAHGPLGVALPSPATKSAFTKHYFDQESTRNDSIVRHIPVKRSTALQKARMDLPVLSEEDEIMRTINENPVTVICGETGSGKTTQIPQFLYEAGYASKNSANPGMIGITQPRRVAAVSMAKRVAHELSLDENRVSHQIRYDASTSPHTQIKFMTDGVLLRELAQDLLLEKYSVIVVDEAHERSVNTDVLIGMLSRVVRLREQRWIKADAKQIAHPLRFVVMSATLRVSDFTQNSLLFPTPPPLISIDARQHPVTIHFNRRTTQDYVTEAVRKASKIHARLPQGGILIFLTGQQEVVTVCQKLQQAYGAEAHVKRSAELDAPSARIADVEAEEIELGVAELDAAVDTDAQEDAAALDSDQDDSLALEHAAMRMHILPLYSLLPTHEQQRVFAAPPEGTRLVVVATNVAETSITIPHIKYVIDTGRAKERRVDAQSQVQSYDIQWISKASAAQRAGRAGRTGPGHCYRLFSSAVYEEVFPAFGTPEILRTPVEGIVLQMKAMNIDNVANFPFPTPPDRTALRVAERMLIHLGALERAEATDGQGRRVLQASITELGRTMALFPITPRYAKLLAQGNQHGCLPYAVALVAALSVGDVFEREDLLRFSGADMDPAEAKEARGAARAAYYASMRIFDALGQGSSDAFRLLSVVGAFAHEAAHGRSLAFCERHSVRLKAMDEIHKLRAQLGRILLANLGGIAVQERERIMDPSLRLPGPAQCKVLRQLLAAMYVDRVAVRADVVGAPEAEGARGVKHASTRGVPYVALGVHGVVYIHPSSTFFHRPPPEWLVFGEVHASVSKEARVEGIDAPPRKQWIKMLTRINPAWLPLLGPTLCNYSQPLDAESHGILGRLAGSVRALRHGTGSGVTERQVMLIPRYGGAAEDGGAGQGLGWELAPVKATQRYEHGRWITVGR